MLNRVCGFISGCARRKFESPLQGPGIIFRVCVFTRFRSAAPSRVRTGEAPYAPEGVHLLRFGSGDVQLYREKLLHCPQLKAIRKDMEQAGYACELTEKALIFVRADQYEATRKALVNKESHPFHIITSAVTARTGCREEGMH